MVLPQIHKELISPKSMVMGKCIKILAIYKSNGQWWKHYNLQGDILSCGGLPNNLMIDVGDESGTGTENEKVPLFPYCFDVSPPQSTSRNKSSTSTTQQRQQQHHNNNYGVLCCFVEGKLYDYFHSIPFEKQKELMIEFLQFSFQNYIPTRTSNTTTTATDNTHTNNAEENSRQQSQQSKQQPKPLWVPDDFVVYDWGPDCKNIAGAYTGYFQPNVLSKPKYWDAYRQVEKSTNLLWAGSDYHAGFGKLL